MFHLKNVFAAIALIVVISSESSAALAAEDGGHEVDPDPRIVLVLN